MTAEGIVEEAAVLIRKQISGAGYAFIVGAMQHELADDIKDLDEWKVTMWDGKRHGTVVYKSGQFSAVNVSPSLLETALIDFPAPITFEKALQAIHGQDALFRFSKVTLNGQLTEHGVATNYFFLGSSGQKYVNAKTGEAGEISTTPVPITATGIVQKQGITTYMYGTHVLLDDKGKTLYALVSKTINLESYINHTVTVHGILVNGYPIDGGPRLLDVQSV